LSPNQMRGFRHVASSSRVFGPPGSGEEAVADEMSALWRMVSCRSMPTVWSTPDERGDWRPSGEGNARLRVLTSVASGPPR